MRDNFRVYLEHAHPAFLTTIVVLVLEYASPAFLTTWQFLFEWSVGGPSPKIPIHEFIFGCCSFMSCPASWFRLMAACLDSLPTSTQQESFDPSNHPMRAQDGRQLTNQRPGNSRFHDSYSAPSEDILSWLTSVLHRTVFFTVDLRKGSLGIGKVDPKPKYLRAYYKLTITLTI